MLMKIPIFWNTSLVDRCVGSRVLKHSAVSIFGVVEDRFVWVGVCVCVSFLMCGCFGNMCICIYCVFVLFRLSIFILICY